MTVRFKIALTIFITGLITALGVIGTVALAFQRFEHETTFERAGVFLARVVALYDNIFDLHERQPDEFAIFLRNLVLLEPDSQLYLLDAAGQVLASTGSVKLAPGFKVALGPVRQAIERYEDRRSGRLGPMERTPYVMGDDPERMDADAVVAAQPLRRVEIRPGGAVAGYLYLVSHRPPLPPGRLAMFRSSLLGPSLATVAAVIALATLLAAWIVAAVTRPLRELSAEVAAVTRDGLSDPGEAGLATGSGPGQGLPALRAPDPGGPPGRADELAQLRHGFHTMLATLRKQWAALRRLDHFRREGISNLSHDLRSPLTATVACLETLEQRWDADGLGHPDAEARRLVEVALRNTRNTARLVQSLGELAQLDEPEFKLRLQPVDLAELLDDIALRFASRAEQFGVRLHLVDAERTPAGAPIFPVAAIDVELFERAIANLVDNALKFCSSGASLNLRAGVDLTGRSVVVEVADTGSGIAAADLPHLFDRFYQSRHTVAPATAEGGKGLGLAIVKRIVELHGGRLSITSELGRGTKVSIHLLRILD